MILLIARGNGTHKSRVGRYADRATPPVSRRLTDRRIGRRGRPIGLSADRRIGNVLADRRIGRSLEGGVRSEADRRIGRWWTPQMVDPAAGGRPQCLS